MQNIGPKERQLREQREARRPRTVTAEAIRKTGVLEKPAPKRKPAKKGKR